MAHINISDAKYYDNRELSWLKFERRVLNEALVKELPILERLKFVGITSSNLDEFFMVRVASLKDMEHAGYTKPDIAGMTPTEQLIAINEKTRELVDFEYSTFNRSLTPLLKESGIILYEKYEDLNENQLKYIDSFFMSQVYPVLTPMAFDASRPFPLIRNKSLNIAALIEKKADTVGVGTKTGNDDVEFATVQVPSVLPRFVSLPSDDKNRYCFILLEQIIERNMDKLFLNYNVVAASPYRIMRNADFNIDEEGAEDLLIEIEKQIKSRQWGEVIRLEVESSVNKKLLAILKKNLGVNEIDIYKIKGPIDLTFLMKLYGIEGHSNLRSPKFIPQENPRLRPGEKIFDEIKRGDILLHHPYQTFDPVVDFIAQAAFDPQVLAIKQTLYRVSGNSPIITSLARAAENGKQVTVLVELKARFDEENNIIWAKKLEKAGCHVIYGLVGLKTHCKIALVVRREEDGIKRYVHLGTGNYNDSTAKLYTDCGILTCRESYGEDATAVFNMLSGYSEPASWNKLVVAPLWLRDTFIRLIDREIRHARDGKEAHIIAKMNSLCDKEIIEKLYEASNAGVKIELIIRGICCLRTGIEGVSENIHVTSIVGAYLEHARIFYFYNSGREDIYMGSADWMPRNLDRRVEIIFPVEDEFLKKQVKHILDVQLADNLKAYEMTDDGNYVRIKPLRGKKSASAQETFCREAKRNNEPEFDFARRRTFTPILANEVSDE
ncbi:polyphosphate kinase [Pseudobutyrivibrio sp. ACV-2]|uniref:RNA degradosome polyphosphate kinase n=1 Tax=Pseudobutyrivibrio sp. ACV-2 TaxID=1520801 RepID=UPI00089A1AF9|nr:RNA degradosome polyphosphate kinase [Pseudobutyrivibrio sp. ACV-2]SDZ84644.1 polyphosphate kinase [Pseudobutyrivibrio sp. ACV-2]